MGSTSNAISASTFKSTSDSASISDSNSKEAVDDGISQGIENNVCSTVGSRAWSSTRSGIGLAAKSKTILLPISEIKFAVGSIFRSASSDSTVKG